MGKVLEARIVAAESLMEFGHSPYERSSIPAHDPGVRRPNIEWRRGSGPKLQVLNTALMTAHTGLALREARENHEFWGRLVESAVGAYLADAAAAGMCELFYWCERNREVDFVTRAGPTVSVIEVKSGRSRDVQPGLTAFAATFKPRRSLFIGGGGIAIEGFLSRQVGHCVRG